jgi:hypothetical protein
VNIKKIKISILVGIVVMGMFAGCGSSSLFNGFVDYYREK